MAKILFIADSTSVHAQRWIRHFSDLENSVYLITLGRKRKTLEYARHVANFDAFYYNSPNFLATLFKTRRLIRQIAPDIVHAHFLHQYGWLGALSGFDPLVVTGWGTDILKLPFASRMKIGRWLTVWTLKKARVVTVTSNHAAQKAISLGAEPRKVNVIFWGVNTDAFRPSADATALRGELKIDAETTVILSNRSFSKLYNNDVVILAMAKVLKKHPTCVLILQDAGGETKEKKRLVELAREQQILDSVRFLPQLPHERMPPLYAMSSIFISVPSWDAGPVSLKEAMASHCAPIISDLPGPREWIQHRENGLVVPARDAARLAIAIEQYLTDPDWMQRICRRNRQLIIEKGSHVSQMQKAEKLYFTLMQTRSR